MSPELNPLVAAQSTEVSDPPATGNLLRSQAEFLLSLSDLIDQLHVNNEPERTDCEFEFFPDLLPTSFELPASITDYCGNDLQALYLSFSKTVDHNHTSSLELRFPDKTLYISRDWANPEPAEPDAVLRDSELEPRVIDRVPRRDINSLILQLVAGRHVGSQEELERIDVFSPDSCNILLDTLPDIAHSKLFSEQHHLGTNRSLAWVMESNGGEDRLLTCRFSYETARPGRAIVALVNLEHGLKVDFQTQENGDVDPYIADEGDMLRLQEVVAELALQHRPRDASTDPVELETLAPDNLPEMDF